VAGAVADDDCPGAVLGGEDTCRVPDDLAAARGSGGSGSSYRRVTLALWLDGSVPMMIRLLTGWNPSRCGMTESRQAGVVT
jgi:hypothetical protein